MCGNYHSKEADVLFKHCNGMHINRPQAQVSLIAAYSLTRAHQEMRYPNVT